MEMELWLLNIHMVAEMFIKWMLVWINISLYGKISRVETEYIKVSQIVRFLKGIGNVEYLCSQKYFSNQKGEKKQS